MRRNVYIQSNTKKSGETEKEDNDLHTPVSNTKTGINDVYTRYTSSRLSPSALIDKDLLQQPV